MNKINACFFATLRKRKIQIIEENEVRNVKFYRQLMNNQLFRFLRAMRSYPLRRLLQICRAPNGKRTFVSSEAYVKQSRALDA